MTHIIAATINWTSVGIVLGIVAALALIFSVLILVVTKICHIHEDEKVVKILENLAGANCGGCGHTGCEGFAKALASGKACLSDCKATSADAKKVIAKIADLPYENDVPTVAVVRCHGGKNSADKFLYVGSDGCINQAVLHGGKKICDTACLGGGTCLKACPYSAVKINENGVAEIDRTKCLSCGACIQKCPKHCIERIPATAPVYVACSTKCKGRETTAFCSVGCIGCGICQKFCPEKAIEMVDNLPRIDYNKCTGCKICAQKCPKKVIQIR